MSKVYVPPFGDILPRLNMDAVADAIWKPRKEGEQPPKYDQDEFENIKEMIYAAGEKWLGRDLVELTIDTIEDRVDVLYEDGTEYKAIIDLSGICRGTMSPFTEFKGHRITVDWKTRDGELDQRWRERLIDSWQWKMYCSANSSSVFSYRGVSRRCTWEPCGTKEILLGIPPTLEEEVENYVKGSVIARKALVDSGLKVWPRNMPDSCFDYGRECPFKVDCDEYSMPQFVPEPNKILSYTAIKYFHRCPEFARRMSAAPSADDTEDSNIGGGFHAGVAEMYKQAKEIKL